MTTTVAETETATKRCTRCKEDKPADQFCTKQYSTDGLNSWCKTCIAEDQREKRHERAEADRVVLDLPKPPRNWRDDAACRGQDVDIWFAEGTGPDEKAVARYAKRICATCPVREPCKLWALGWRGQLAGIWGGLTQEDRRSIKRREADERQRASA